MDNDGNLQPSAFIPYCEIGGDMSGVSINISHFKHFPVCNIFKPKFYKNQVCYEVDIGFYGNSPSIYKKGLIFLMDYNIDRQFVSIQRGIPVLDVKTNSLGTIVADSEDITNVAHIIIEAIGKCRSTFLPFTSFFYSKVLKECRKLTFFI